MEYQHGAAAVQSNEFPRQKPGALDQHESFKRAAGKPGRPLVSGAETAGGAPNTPLRSPLSGRVVPSLDLTFTQVRSTSISRSALRETNKSGTSGLGQAARWNALISTSDTYTSPILSPYQSSTGGTVPDLPRIPGRALGSRETACCAWTGALIEPAEQ